MKLVLSLLLTVSFALAQSTSVFFDDVKIFYQRSGETKWQDDKGLLVLNGSQKVMLLLKDNKPLFVMRYDNIQSLTFDEKHDKTLTIEFGGSGPSGSVRMELPGKWKDIVQSVQAQSEKTVQMVSKK